jgi:hypothetical protein
MHESRGHQCKGGPMAEYFHLRHRTGHRKPVVICLRKQEAVKLIDHRHAHCWTTHIDLKTTKSIGYHAPEFCNLGWTGELVYTYVATCEMEADCLNKDVGVYLAQCLENVQRRGPRHTWYGLQL